MSKKTKPLIWHNPQFAKRITFYLYKCLYTLLLFFSQLGFISCNSSSKLITYENLFLVCGDSKVLLVDHAASRDSTPQIIWYWDAHFAEDLPYVFRNEKFNGIDDCKSVLDGSQILVSSSTGAVAIIEKENKSVIFYAEVPNAHSIELLPGNLLVAASSTAYNGNKIVMFNLEQSGKLLYSDSLYSAHGLVWDKERKSLFALGYDVLREYKLHNELKLEMVNEWTIPGFGGHDLQMASHDDKLLLTENTGAWYFDLNKYSFYKIDNFPDQNNLKSVNQNINGQFLYTVAEESWWAHHVRFLNPGGILAFPDIRLYKARWFNKTKK